jgi:prevent-host-death family protein
MKPRARRRAMTIPAGEFKSQCLKLMDRVARDRIPIVITKRGRSVAKLVPADDESPDLFGYMAGTIEFLGDVVSPLDVDWKAQR